MNIVSYWSETLSSRYRRRFISEVYSYTAEVFNTAPLYLWVLIGLGLSVFLYFGSTIAQMQVLDMGQYISAMTTNPSARNFQFIYGILSILLGVGAVLFSMHVHRIFWGVLFDTWTFIWRYAATAFCLGIFILPIQAVLPPLMKQLLGQHFNGLLQQHLLAPLFGFSWIFSAVTFLYWYQIDGGFAELGKAIYFSGTLFIRRLPLVFLCAVLISAVNVLPLLLYMHSPLWFAPALLNFMSFLSSVFSAIISIVLFARELEETKRS